MFQIDQRSRQPVYEQVIDQMERFILSGVIKPGEKIPSVRSLSIELSINPNTIQKAYSQLDARGILYSVPGRGCFITDDAVQVLKNQKQKKLWELRELLLELKLGGVNRTDIFACVEEIYGEHEKPGNKEGIV